MEKEREISNIHPYKLRAFDFIPVYGLNNYEKRTENNEELGVTNRYAFLVLYNLAFVMGSIVLAAKGLESLFD